MAIHEIRRSEIKVEDLELAQTVPAGDEIVIIEDVVADHVLKPCRGEMVNLVNRENGRVNMSKIDMIKLVRQLTGAGLREANYWVETAFGI